MTNHLRPFFVLFSVVLVATRTAVAAVESSATKTADQVSKTSIGHPMQNEIKRDGQIDTGYLMLHAMKINKNHIRRRRLEEGGEDQDGENEGEGENNNNDNDNDNNNNNEDNNNEDQNGEDEGEENDNQENEEQNEGDQNEGDEEEGNNDQNNDENNEEQNGDDEEEDAEEEQNEEQEDNNEEQEDGQDNDQEEDAEEENNGNDGEDEDQNEEQQIKFLKCGAFSIEPNVVDVDTMIENGEIDEDEAAEIKKAYVTEMSSNLNTQESIVFFTFGEGADEEDSDVYMVSINDWITASSGYDQVCNAIDQDDVDQVFSKVPFYSTSSVEEYADHTWYAGFNCKADGTGFKTQLFLDDTCNTFSPTINQHYPFKSYASEDGATQVKSDMTQYMIESANDSIQNPQYCDQSEFCDNVLENSIDLATCDGGGDEEEGDGKEEGDGNDRKLASYQIEYDAASSVEDACPSIQTALGVEDGYGYSSDEMTELVSSWSNKMNGGQESDWTNYDLLLICLLGLFVGYILTALVRSCCTKKYKMGKKSSFDTDDTAASKKQPLMDHSDIQRSDSDIVEVYSAIECTLKRKKRRKPKKKKSSPKKVLSPRSRRMLGMETDSDSKDSGDEVNVQPELA